MNRLRRLRRRPRRRLRRLEVERLVGAVGREELRRAVVHHLAQPDVDVDRAERLTLVERARVVLHQPDQPADRRAAVDAVAVAAANLDGGRLRRAAGQLDQHELAVRARLDDANVAEAGADGGGDVGGEGSRPRRVGRRPHRHVRGLGRLPRRAGRAEAEPTRRDAASAGGSGGVRRARSRRSASLPCRRRWRTRDGSGTRAGSGGAAPRAGAVGEAPERHFGAELRPAVDDAVVGVPHLDLELAAAEIVVRQPDPHRRRRRRPRPTARR